MDPNRFKDPHYLVTNKTVNREAKKMLLRPENIDSFAKAVTHYAFRNGPVEDMHTEKKLSQDDMRTLNKYMVNRLAGLFSLMLDGQWAKLMAVYEHCYKRLGKDWDPAEPDTAEIEALFELFCLDMKDGEND